MGKPVLHRVIFLHEDGAPIQRREHSYAFVSRKAAERFVDYGYYRCWWDGAIIRATDGSDEPQNWGRPPDWDMPF